MSTPTRIVCGTDLVSATNPFPIVPKTGGAAGVPAGDVQSIQGVASGTAVPVSSTTLATAAKQPALGTAGAPSADLISTQGFGYTGTFTVTRAANTTAYTANDVVGGALTIATVGPAIGEILITAIRLMLNITALPSGMTTFTLHLYDVTPPSAIADNSPFTLASGDRAAYLGSINGIAASLVGTGTSSVKAVLELSPAQQFKIASGSQLFAYLVTDGAFTPAANSETYTGKAKAIGI